MNNKTVWIIGMICAISWGLSKGCEEFYRRGSRSELRQVQPNETSESPAPKTSIVSQPIQIQQPDRSFVEAPQYEDLSAVGGEPRKYRAIGLSVQEAADSFGRIFQSGRNPASGLILCTCRKGELAVSYEFCNNKICSVVFLEWVDDNDPSAPQLTDKQIREILRDNSGGQPWKRIVDEKGSLMWVSSDGQVIARPGLHGSLRMFTTEWRDMSDTYQGKR